MDRRQAASPLTARVFNSITPRRCSREPVGRPRFPPPPAEGCLSRPLCRRSVRSTTTTAHAPIPTFVGATGPAKRGWRKPDIPASFKRLRVRPRCSAILGAISLPISAVSRSVFPRRPHPSSANNLRRRVGFPRERCGPDQVHCYLRKGMPLTACEHHHGRPLLTDLSRAEVNGRQTRDTPPRGYPA